MHGGAAAAAPLPQLAPAPTGVPLQLGSSCVQRGREAVGSPTQGPAGERVQEVRLVRRADPPGGEAGAAVECSEAGMLPGRSVCCTVLGWVLCLSRLL
mmetsp:Transcript_23700/g.52012  ORF Transcript_23700/g.52012 Transcript_23700/m.52012 type:complete len:98 (+) Transcript_23700:2028-2321(+)